MNPQKPIRLRNPMAEDVSFVYSSWLEAHRFSDECKRMNNEVYYRRFKSIITKILKDSNLLVACDPDDLDTFYGYISFKMIDDIPVIHWIYVKYLYRHLGVCRQMISHVTDLSKPMMCTFANKFNVYIRGKWTVSYDPFLR